jgi:hypothetical protein
VAYKEVRILYKKDALDVETMEQDIDIEWRRLYGMS